MLFRKNMEPRCEYCKHSTMFRDGIGCVKHGIVEAGYRCSSFKYDPFKRVPPKPVRLIRKFKDEDFSIN